MDDSLAVRIPLGRTVAGVTGRVAPDRPGHTAANVPSDFAAFYQATMPRLYSYLRARCSGDEAGDLTQQTYLQALRAWQRRPVAEDGLVPWLFHIGRNVATDTYRKNHGTVGWDSLPDALQPIANDYPEAQAVRRELLTEVRDLVAALPPAKQEILALRFAADLTYREIAVLLGRREAAVKKEVSRLLEQMRRRA